MKFADLDLSKRYTYADYLTWDFPERVELILGKIFRMSSAPSAGHQVLSQKLSLQMGNFFNGGNCQVYYAPFDVRLPLPPDRRKPEQIDTVVQPDICVICDPEKVDKRGCLGPPDWIIEILSPSTSRKDAKDKFDLYQHAGVKEYWLVSPADKLIYVYVLNDQGAYTALPAFSPEDAASPALFPDLRLDLTDVFPSPELVEEPYAEYMRL